MSKQSWIKRGLQIVLVLAVFGVVGLGAAYFGGHSVAQAQGAATATATTAATVQPTSAATAQPTSVATRTPGSTPNATTAPSSATNIGNDFWTRLAAKLNVSVETLKNNALQVRKDMLDQAVKDGRATQAQVDQLKQRLDPDNLIAPITLPGAGNQQQPNLPNPMNPRGQQQLPPMNPHGQQQLPPMGRGHGFGMNPNQKPGNGLGGLPKAGLRGGASLDMLEAAAKALSLSPSDLVNQLAGGKTLADIATSKNVDQAKLKQAIVDARNAEIDRQVTDGLITQAQATAMKANLTADKIDLTRPLFSVR